MLAHDLNAEDFPASIYVHTDRRSVGATWVWAVTVLPPSTGARVPLRIPSFADVAPVWVTVRLASERGSTTTGPYREERPMFRCPRCGMTSAHPTDVEQGYCGNCHDWTGEQ